MPFCDECAQGVPEFPHDGRRVQRVPLHIAYGDQGPVPPGQRLVEVTADLGLVTRGQVAERHVHPRYHGQRRGQETALQGKSHEVLFRLGAESFDTQRDGLHELTQDLRVLLTGNALAGSRERHGRSAGLGPRRGEADFAAQRAVGH